MRENPSHHRRIQDFSSVDGFAHPWQLLFFLRSCFLHFMASLLKKSPTRKNPNNRGFTGLICANFRETS
jgi:hypothetical protein